MNDRLRRIALLGAPSPAPGSSRAVRLRAVRSYQLRWLFVTALAFVISQLTDSALAAVFGMGTILLLADVAWLTVQLRRAA